MLRRAAATGFRAACLIDPGGKMGAAARFNAPSPSPTPVYSPSLASDGIVGESIPLWSFTWAPKGHPDSPMSFLKDSPRMTPLPALMAEVENECQLPMTDGDLLSEPDANYPPAHVHFDVEEQEPFPDSPLQLFGRSLPMEPPRRNLVVSPERWHSESKVSTPQGRYKPVYRTSPPPNGSPPADQPSPRSMMSLFGQQLPMHQETKKQIETDTESAQPIPSPSFECGADLAPGESSRLLGSCAESRLLGTSIETPSGGGLEGKWFHDDDPEQFEIVRDGLVTSLDGTVRELSIKAASIAGQGKLFLSTAHGRHLPGLLDPEGCSIRWEDGQVWRRDLSLVASLGLGSLSQRDAESSSATLGCDAPTKSGQKHDRQDAMKPAFGNMPAELRRLIKGILPHHSPRAFKRSAGMPQDEELSQDLAELPVGKAPAVSVQVQCTDREFTSQAVAPAEGGAVMQPQGQMPSRTRWVSVHRCEPEMVNLSTWKKIEGIPAPLSQGIAYHRRFRETFPGAMDSDRLANKAGGSTLAQLAAQKALVSQKTGRMKLTQRAGRLTWR